MKKITTVLMALFIASLNCAAISNRIALVKPNGVTTIHNTLQSAYMAAADNDKIYLPGGTFSFTGDSVAKKLSIYGAGFNSDSTLVTGTTKIASGNNSIQIYPAGSGSHFEGIEFTGNGIYGGDNQASFYRCKMVRINSFINSIFKDCVIGGNTNISDCVIAIDYSIIESSIVIAAYYQYGSTYLFSSCNSTSIRNCILMTNVNNSNFYIGGNSSAQNCIFQNNIIENGGEFNSSTSIFQNNLVVGVPWTLGPNEYNTIFTASNTDVFQQNLADFTFNQSYNYQLKATCVGKNAGTDGTDVGIYGGSNPCSIGWVPSNPHIYYENVSTQSNNQGKLPVHFKVRSGD